MAPICELCKLLNNPVRLEVLLRTYAARDGMNVSILASDMQMSGLGLSGVSQYLKQLERLGLLRRMRSGLYVNYYADAKEALPKVRQALNAIVASAGKDWRVPCAPVFGVLMNPIRARIVAAVAQAGAISAREICEHTNHPMKYLKRDLRPAVEVGLLTADDSDPSVAVYRYIEPQDPTVRLLVSLAR